MFFLWDRLHQLEVLVALDDLEALGAVEALHLGDGEVAPFLGEPAHEAERLTGRRVVLGEPPVPAARAREVVDENGRVLGAVLRVQRRQPLGDLPCHECLHVFLRSGRVALRISSPCGQSRMAAPRVVVRFAPCKAAPERRGVKGGPRDLHQSKWNVDLCGVSWVPFTPRSVGATRAAEHEVLAGGRHRGAGNNGPRLKKDGHP